MHVIYQLLIYTYNNMISISTAELTTLSLGVVAKYTIGQVYTEYEPRESDLGVDLRDDEHCINTGGGYREFSSLVCKTHSLVIDINLKQKALLYKYEKYHFTNFLLRYEKPSLETFTYIR